MTDDLVNSHSKLWATQRGVMTLRIIILLTIFACCTSMAGKGNGEPAALEFSKLRCDSTLATLIRLNMPEEYASSLAKLNLTPDAVNFYVTASYYHVNRTDTSSTVVLIFYSNGVGDALVQVLQLEDGVWNVVASNSRVAGEASLGIGFRDVDCDGINEIILTSVTGAAGRQTMDIVKFKSDSLWVISPTQEGQRLVGRILELTDIDNDCIQEIEVWLDGSIKYQPDRKRVYRLDQKSGRFELEYEEKLEVQKK